MLFGALYATGALGRDPNSALTYGFALAAVMATAIVLALPRLLAPRASAPHPVRFGRIAKVTHLLRDSLGEGVEDALGLLRARSIGVLAGSLGWVAFDVAVLGACFEAFGHSPAIGVLALGYLIGQLGGNIPIPGGIGGVDAGLIGTFALYHQPLAATTAAVLIYHAIALWVPALPGSVAFVQLRRALEREALPVAMCMPLTDTAKTAGDAPLAR